MGEKIDKVVYSRYRIRTSDFIILEIDEQFTRMLGYTKDDIETGRLTQKDIMFDEDWDEYVSLLGPFQQRGGEAYLCHRLRKKTGQELFVFCFGENVVNRESGEAEGRVLITDVTNNEILREELSYKNILLEKVMNNMAGGIGVFLADGDSIDIRFLSDGFYEMIGLKRRLNRVCREELERFMTSETCDGLLADLKEAAHSCGNLVSEYPLGGSGKRWIQIRFSGFQVAGRPGYVIAIFLDITRKKKAELELIRRAMRDSLTGVYNHNTFVEKVEKYLKAGREGRCAMMMIDQDNFKAVNDTVGHDEGDALLRRTAYILQQELKESYKDALLGRMGGDEFAVFLPYVQDAECLKNIAGTISALEKGRWNGVQTSVSIGITVREYGGLGFQELYHEADQALYVVKRGGKGHFAFYSGQLLREEALADADSSYIEDMGLVLDDVDNLVYVADVDTCELLYVNDAVKRVFEDEERGVHWRNMPCYRYIWGKDRPVMPFNMKELRRDRDYIWESYNEKTKRRYVLKDRIVQWKGQMARLEVATDVTDIRDVKAALASRYELEETLQKCISRLVNYGDFETNHDHILQFIGEFYQADGVCLIETKDDGSVKRVYEWKNDISQSFGNAVQKWDTEKEAGLTETYDQKSILVVDHINKIKTRMPKLYQLLLTNHVWGMYLMPLFREDKLQGRLAVLNMRKHAGELTMLSIFGIFLINELAKKAVLERQEYELLHDPLTGVYNRKYYLDFLSRIKEPGSVGIVSVDVNGLKQINDDYGYTYGSRVVCEIADILKEVFRDYLVCRFDGDDFIVCCIDVDRERFTSMVTEVRKRFSAHKSGASMGYAWDDCDMDIKQMSLHAEEILKTEKQRYYESLSENSIYHQKEVIEDVRRNLEQGRFIVYFQPKVDLKTKEVCGAEALIRFLNDGRLCPPAKFIPLLEKTETIHYVDLYVLKRVCATLQKWKEEGRRVVPVSLNFSRKTLLLSDLEERVEQVLSRFDVPRDWVEIEITETIGDVEYDMIARIAGVLREKGLKLVMDDFGSKYSSVSILSIMRFETLKIDRSMVNNLTDNVISRKVMQHAINMCRDLGICCVAEGVETKEQEALLEAMECDVAQGYLYGRPGPVEELERMLG